MKQRDVVIEFGDIANLWCDDNTTAEQHAGISPESEGVNPPTYDSGVYSDPCVVSWPEHVLAPLYDCNCSISFIAEHEAIRLLSSGEAAGYRDLPWKLQKHEMRHKLVANLQSLIDADEEPDWCDVIESVRKVLKEFCGDYTTKE